MSEVQYNPRRWWISALLVLISPVGFIYVGSLMAFWIIFTWRVFSFTVVYVGISSWFAQPLPLLGLFIVDALAILVVAVATIWMAIRRRDYVLKWYNRIFIYIIAAAVMIVLVITPELSAFKQKIETYYLTSRSMFPTLLKDDYFIADQRASVAASVVVGDVIVTRNAKKGSMPYVYRLIGFPGDRIRLVNGVPEINGVLLRQERVDHLETEEFGKVITVEIRREFLPSGRSYLITHNPELAARWNTDLVEVGSDEFFILGDNRENSVDSRFPRPNGVGLLKRKEISGVVTGIYWSSDGRRIGQRIDLAN